MSPLAKPKPYPFVTIFYDASYHLCCNNSTSNKLAFPDKIFLVKKAHALPVSINEPSKFSGALYVQCIEILSHNNPIFRFAYLKLLPTSAFNGILL